MSADKPVINGNSFAEAELFHGIEIIEDDLP